MIHFFTNNKYLSKNWQLWSVVRIIPHQGRLHWPPEKVSCHKMLGCKEKENTYLRSITYQNVLQESCEKNRNDKRQLMKYNDCKNIEYDERKQHGIREDKIGCHYFGILVEGLEWFNQMTVLLRKWLIKSLFPWHHTIREKCTLELICCGIIKS